MTAALGTLAFLTTIWLLAVVGAAVLEESGAKIVAALKGQSREPQMTIVSGRIRTRSQLQQPMRARPEWRAAA